MNAPLAPVVLRAATGPRPDPFVTRRCVPLSDGRTIAYAEAGEGPPVVLIHGTLTLLEDMRLALMPRLAPHYRVAALDRTGHGSSARVRLRDASPWRQAETIRDALRELGIRRPIIVGHSYGGSVALCHGLAHPDETAGVVALAPLCFPEMRLEQVLFGARSVPLFGDGLAHILATGLDPAPLPLLWRAIFLPQHMPADFAAGPEHMSIEGEDAMATWSALSRAAVAYPGCQVRVRIYGGTADLVVNNALHGAQAARLMPQAHFEWLPGLGHMLHHFAQETIVAALRDFGGRQ